MIGEMVTTYSVFISTQSHDCNEVWLPLDKTKPVSGTSGSCPFLLQSLAQPSRIFIFVFLGGGGSGAFSIGLRCNCGFLLDSPSWNHQTQAQLSILSMTKHVSKIWITRISTCDVLTRSLRSSIIMKTNSRWENNHNKTQHCSALR